MPPHPVQATRPNEIDTDAWRQRIRDTTFANYHYEMGVAIERAEGSASAIDAFSRAVAIRPDWPAASLRLCEALRSAGRIGEASRVDATARAARPDYEFHALCRIGMETLLQGRVDEAGMRFDAALAIQPDHPKALNGLAMCAWQRGRYNEAKAIYARVGAMGEEDARELAEMHGELAARAEMASGNPSAGLDDWKRATTLDQSDVVARLRLCLALTHRQDWYGALEHAEAVVRIEPSMRDSHGELFGRIYIATGRNADAIPALQAAVRAAPANPSPRYLLAQALLAALRADEALTTTQELIEIAPRSLEGFMTLGDCHVFLGNHEAAYAAYRSAIGTAKDNVVIWALFGHALLVGGRTAEARVAILRSRVLGPSDARAMTNHGLLLDRDGRSEEALGFHQRAVRLDSSKAWQQTNLGLSLDALGRTAEAEEAILRGATVQPGLIWFQARMRPWAYERLKVIYERHGIRP